jgi:septum formation protein
MQILLASTSPRRRELLALLGLPFLIVPPTCKETLSPHLSPSEQTRHLARDKAQSVASQHLKDLVVGSDTVIEIEGRFLGKPESMQEAETMLRQLRGRYHQVHTGVAIIQQATNVCIDFVETALVWIKPFDETTLTSYLATEESLGKAGSYSIQGEGAQLIDKIEGDYPTIVGLPLWRTAKALEHYGIVLLNPVEEIYRVKPYANWKDFS